MNRKPSKSAGKAVQRRSGTGGRARGTGERRARGRKSHGPMRLLAYVVLAVLASSQLSCQCGLETMPLQAEPAAAVRSGAASSEERAPGRPEIDNSGSGPPRLFWDRLRFSGKAHGGFGSGRESGARKPDAWRKLMEDVLGSSTPEEP